jgi:hypothetical protein
MAGAHQELERIENAWHIGKWPLVTGRDLSTPGMASPMLQKYPSPVFGVHLP